MTQKLFDSAKAAVNVCTKCKLCQTRTNSVFGEGNENAQIMFIGEGPGAQEDATGRPFVGKAGQLLDKMLASIGLTREEVYIANVVKCRPPGNADPLPEYAKACMPYLRAQFLHIKPQVIVCLGRIAMSYILHVDGITKNHGKVFTRGGVYIVPTYHPAALLRNASLKRDAWSDLLVIKSLLDEEKQ